jgi:hypothetical protein
MIHIRQKQIDSLVATAYTVVDTSEWVGDLEDHPSIVNHPDLFEIVDTIIPDNAQYLIYQ